MRKGETLEQESERKKFEAELPARIDRCRNRVRALSKTVADETSRIQKQNGTNAGGERNGTIEC